MDGLIAEKSFTAFFIVTVLLGGGAAFLAGRSLARSWRSLERLLLYMLLLGAAVRFLHWGLFVEATFLSWREVQGTLSLHYYVVDTLILMAIATLGYRFERAAQMTTQYNWLYERTGPFTWRKR
jgi:hypothetical protein